MQNRDSFRKKGYAYTEDDYSCKMIISLVLVIVFTGITASAKATHERNWGSWILRVVLNSQGNPVVKMWRLVMPRKPGMTKMWQGTEKKTQEQQSATRLGAILKIGLTTGWRKWLMRIPKTPGIWVSGCASDAKRKDGLRSNSLYGLVPIRP